MNLIHWHWKWTLTAFLLVSSLATVESNDEPTGQNNKEPRHTQQDAPTAEQARRQAAILHSAIDSALRVVHDRYYREDEGLPIPALALKEVFEDLESTENIQLRWLAVEGQAMNTDHVAGNDFEKNAVEKLKFGKSSHEQIAEGYYFRAAPITLSNHCLKCHMPDRKSTRDRKAGLIISMPIRP